MLEESSAEGIDVGVRVLDLADGAKNTGNGLEASSSKVADVVVLDVLISEGLQVHESGIGVSEDSMTVAWDNSAFSQSFSDELFDDFLVRFFSLVVVFEACEPLEALLVGKTVQRSSETVHGSRVREIGVSKGRANQHVSMS